MTTLPYTIPFTGFSHLGFLSCVAGVLTYLEQTNPSPLYPTASQQKLYFLLGTLCGQNSRFDYFDETKNIPASIDEQIDFVFGFMGYRYEFVEKPADYTTRITASIENGYPVLAELDAYNTYRVIIGCENGTMVYANPKDAQGDTADPTLDHVKRLIIVTERMQPIYTLLDGLKNVEASLVYSIESVWPEILSHFPEFFDAWDKMYQKEPFEKTKAAFERLLRLMWNFDHCHNVSEAFGTIAKDLQDTRLKELCRHIDGGYRDSHDMQWAMQALYDLRDWNKREWCSKELGMFIHANHGIVRLCDNDKNTLADVREMIAILENM